MPRYLTIVLFLMLGTTSPAQAQDTVCTGTLSGTYGNVIVNGGSCTLSGAVVTGNVTVSNDGTLLTTNGTSISGALSATNGGLIDLDNAILSSLSRLIKVRIC